MVKLPLVFAASLRHYPLSILPYGDEQHLEFKLLESEQSRRKETKWLKFECQSQLIRVTEGELHPKIENL